MFTLTMDHGACLEISKLVNFKAMKRLGADSVQMKKKLNEETVRYL